MRTRRWEYSTILCNPSDEEVWLNEKDAEDWELVTKSYMPGNPYMSLWYFRRPFIANQGRTH